MLPLLPAAAGRLANTPWVMVVPAMVAPLPIWIQAEPVYMYDVPPLTSVAVYTIPATNDVLGRLASVPDETKVEMTRGSAPVRECCDACVPAAAVPAAVPSARSDS